MGMRSEKMSKKKGVSLVITVLMVSMVTGCFGGTKTLTCTEHTEDSGIPTEQKMILTTKRNAIQQMTLSVDMDVSKQEESVRTAAYEALKKAYESYNATGVEVSVKQKDNNLVVLLELDFAKASETDIQKFISDYDADKKTIDLKKYQKQMEDDGLTCKNS